MFSQIRHILIDFSFLLTLLVHTHTPHRAFSPFRITKSEVMESSFQYTHSDIYILIKSNPKELQNPTTEKQLQESFLFAIKILLRSHPSQFFCCFGEKTSERGEE